MKRVTVIVICMLSWLVMFSGCGKSDTTQKLDLSNSIEIDDVNAEVEPEEEYDTNNYTLSDGITYSFKDPENSDGIEVTPRE